jgi:hypothetical protein
LVARRNFSIPATTIRGATRGAFLDLIFSG